MLILEILLFIMSYVLIMSGAICCAALIWVEACTSRLPTDEEVNDLREGRRRHYDFGTSTRIE